MPDDAAHRRLTLTVDWPEITLDSLSRVSSLWAQLVESVSEEATGRRKGIRWVLKSVRFSSPLEITAEPEVANHKMSPAVAGRVSHAVVTGLGHLIRYQDQPELFSTETLSIARKLAELSDPLQQRRLSVSNGSGGPVEVTARVVASVDEIFGPVVESFGSVEGMLEGVITHGKRRFFVYDSLVGRQVRCHFDNMRLPLKDVLDAFEKRVAVGGLVRSKALTGERISVDAREFSVFPSDADLPSVAEIHDRWSRQ